MKKEKQPTARKGSAPAPGKNQGEGDKASAKRYNQEQQAFVQSGRGKRAIEQAGNVPAADVPELADAEASGKARAKGEDPAVNGRGNRR